MDRRVQDSDGEEFDEDSYVIEEELDGEGAGGD